MANYPKHVILSGVMKGLDYTLTGNDRNAMKSLGGDESMELMYDVSISDPPRYKFSPDKVLRIKRVRIVTAGAPGLCSAADGDNACEIILVQGQKNGSGITVDVTAPKYILDILHFNEWQEVAVNVRFNSDDCILGLGKNTLVNVDDFNIQDDYVGQDVVFVLELDAELYTGA